MGGAERGGGGENMWERSMAVRRGAEKGGSVAVKKELRYSVILGIASNLDRGEGEEKSNVLSTLDMIPRQGFSADWFGRRTRSFGKGGRRGVEVTALELGFAGIVCFLGGGVGRG